MEDFLTKSRKFHQSSNIANANTQQAVGKVGRAALTLRGQGNRRIVCYHRKISSIVLMKYTYFSREYTCIVVKNSKYLINCRVSIINHIKFSYNFYLF